MGRRHEIVQGGALERFVLIVGVEDVWDYACAPEGPDLSFDEREELADD